MARAGPEDPAAGVGLVERRRQLVLGMRGRRLPEGEPPREPRRVLPLRGAGPGREQSTPRSTRSCSSQSGSSRAATTRRPAAGPTRAASTQIWPSTGRLLAHALGWTYDDSLLFDPEKNTQAAALYLDVLFSTYKDPQMVLAEYNGGPLNAGYLRAGVAALAAETRNYVPRVLELHQRLQHEFEEGTALALQTEAPGEGAGRRERRWGRADARRRGALRHTDGGGAH